MGVKSFAEGVGAEPISQEIGSPKSPSLGKAKSPALKAGDFTLRRGWDLNPRRLAPQRFSRPSHSAALAPLPFGGRIVA